MFRAGGETWITGSYDPDLNLTYWGTAQAKPWMPASRGMTIARQGALHQLDARAESRHRQAGVVLPARARRGARPRRGLRARAGRRRRPEAGVHRSARPASCGSSIARPASSSATRRRSSRTSSTASIRRPASRATAPTSSKRKVGEWVHGCPSTEGGHNWQAMSYHRRTQPADHSAQPELHRDRRGRQVEFKEGSGGTRGATAASSRCRAPTATSASSRRTTCRR